MNYDDALKQFQMLTPEFAQPCKTLTAHPYKSPTPGRCRVCNHAIEATWFCSNCGIGINPLPCCGMPPNWVKGKIIDADNAELFTAYCIRCLKCKLQSQWATRSSFAIASWNYEIQHSKYSCIPLFKQPKQMAKTEEVQALVNIDWEIE